MLRRVSCELIVMSYSLMQKVIIYGAAKTLEVSIFYLKLDM